MRALVTGGAGFIGSHLVERLLGQGHEVVVIDDFNEFYSRVIKERNLDGIRSHRNFRLHRLDITDAVALRAVEGEHFDAVVHLAARAGVRPSIADPLLYQEVNVRGTQNLLDLARRGGIKQFLFASSSSVYGLNPEMPWSEETNVLRPISPYASTKLSAEFLGHVYSHLYGIRFIALRFFTVYGPRQRPDLAIHHFARLLLAGQELPFYGDGSSSRDYTYIDDVISGVVAALAYDQSGFEIFNLGNHAPTRLAELVALLEDVFERRAELRRMPNQPGDVPHTRADITKACRLLGYRPQTPLVLGLQHFREWLLDPAKSGLVTTGS